MGDMSVKVLWGVSPEGRLKIQEILLNDPEAQMFGSAGVVVSIRYMESIQEQLEEEGFTFMPDIGI